jgi:hypothetical protein
MLAAEADWSAVLLAVDNTEFLVAPNTHRGFKCWFHEFYDWFAVIAFPSISKFLDLIRKGHRRNVWFNLDASGGKFGTEPGAGSAVVARLAASRAVLDFTDTGHFCLVFESLD